MKLPFSEKLLLQIFETIQKADKASDFFAPRSIQQALNPELFHHRKEYARKEDRKKFLKLVSYLKKKGYINSSPSQGIMLTLKGAQKALHAKLKTTEKKRRADGKWIMIIFDIPEKKRILRDTLRDMLVSVGYEKLQGSVWVCPYEVFKETEQFINAYHLDLYVKLFIIEEIETFHK